MELFFEYDNRTKEDLIQDIEDIYDYLKNGIPYRIIQEELGVSQRFIIKTKDFLIDNNKLTIEQLLKARSHYRAENPTIHGLDKRRVRKEPEPSHKLEERREKVALRKQKVLDALKAGKNTSEIENTLNELSKTVLRWKDEFIEEGLLESKDINTSTKRWAHPKINRNSIEYLVTREEVVKLLKLGYLPKGVKEKAKIDSYYYDLLVRDIKRYNILSAEKIREAQKYKELKDLQSLAHSIKMGFSITEWISDKPEYTPVAASKLQNMLLELGITNKEELNRNSGNSKKRTLNQCSLSPDEQYNIVKNAVLTGISPEEIFETYPNGFCNIGQIYNYKHSIILSGIIPAEEARNRMVKHAQEKHNKKSFELGEKTKKYIEQGYTQEEIAGIMSMSEKSFREYLKIYKKQYGWYTNQQLNKFRKDRANREAKLAEEHRIKEERIEERKRAQQIVEQCERKRLEQLKVELDRINNSIKNSNIYSERILRTKGITQKDIEKRMEMAQMHPEIIDANLLEELIVPTYNYRGESAAKDAIAKLSIALGKNNPYVVHFQQYKKSITVDADLKRIRKNRESLEEKEPYQS